MQEAHVSIERMQEVVNHYDAFFTETEEAHIQQCDDCLWAFTRLLLAE
jgi:hypothetical protein